MYNVSARGLQALDDQPARVTLRTSLCEGIDAVFLSLLHAIDTGDEDFWTFSKELTGDRSELMRKMRNEYWKTDPPLDDAQHSRVIAITSSVEQIFS